MTRVRPCQSERHGKAAARRSEMCSGGQPMLPMDFCGVMCWGRRRDAWEGGAKVREKPRTKKLAQSREPCGVVVKRFVKSATVQGAAVLVSASVKGGGCQHQPKRRRRFAHALLVSALSL